MSQSDLDIDAEESTAQSVELETEDKAPGSGSGVTRREVHASTITQMMGIATRSEMELLEGKIDLLTSKINAVSIRLEKMSSAFQKMPTGSDLERIDVNIGALKTLIRDAMRELSFLQQASATASPDVQLEPGLKASSAETSIIESDDDDDSDDESLRPRIFSNQSPNEVAEKPEEQLEQVEQDEQG